MSLTKTYSHVITITIMIQNISITPKSPHMPLCNQSPLPPGSLIPLLSVIVLLCVEFKSK